MNIPFIKQSHDNEFMKTCGVACIQMISGYYGINVPQEDVWRKVASKSPVGYQYCKTYSITKWFLDNGYVASTFSAKVLSDVLYCCNGTAVPAILLHRVKLNVNQPHFFVFSEIRGSSVYVNDPALNESSGKHRRINIRQMEQLMKEDNVGVVTADNIILVVAPATTPSATYKCSHCESDIPAIADFVELSTLVLCPHCDQWHNLT